MNMKSLHFVFGEEGRQTKVRAKTFHLLDRDDITMKGALVNNGEKITTHWKRLFWISKLFHKIEIKILFFD